MLVPYTRVYVFHWITHCKPLQDFEEYGNCDNHSIFSYALFSGTSIPYEVLPGGMQKIANVLPLGVGIRLMKAVSSSAGIAGHVHELIILVVIAVVCGGIAVKTFKWE